MLSLLLSFWASGGAPEHRLAGFQPPPSHSTGTPPPSPVSPALNHDGRQLVAPRVCEQTIPNSAGSRARAAIALYSLLLRCILPLASRRPACSHDISPPPSSPRLLLVLQQVSGNPLPSAEGGGRGPAYFIITHPPPSLHSKRPVSFHHTCRTQNCPPPPTATTNQPTHVCRV